MVGGPGMGRTALLDATVAAAPSDVHVLHAVGVADEQGMAYAGLSALCRPLRSLVDTLPGPTRRSLESALTLEPEQATSPHSVGTGLVDLLAAAAERGPVLAVVDDHQWLDEPSRQALAFAVRRLGGERVCVLLGHRTPTDPTAAHDLPALPSLVLGPLDRADARQVLRDHAPAVAAPVAEAIIATAAGSPLVLTAVVQALTPAQLAGQESVPDPLPTSLSGPLVEPLDGIEGSLATALATAAAEPSGDVTAIRAALGRLYLQPALLEQAEQRRLVTVVDGRVVFASPLLRSAAYHRLPPAPLRRVHAALAEVTHPDDVELRAWHLAEASVEKSDEVADLLLAAGRRAVSRGVPEQAAAAFQRAGRLSADPLRRTAATLAAAQQAVAAGNIEQATTLAQEIERTTDDVLARGEARIVLARMTSLVGDPTTAFHAVQELVDVVVATSPELAARLCVEAVALAFKAATTQAIPLAERAEQLARQGDDAGLLLRARVALGVARALHGEQPPEGGLLPLVEQALNDGVPVVDLAGLLTEASLGLHATGHGDEGLALIGLVARAARSARAVGVLPQVLLARADLETTFNRYHDAWATTAEAAELADRLGQHAVRRDLAFRLAALQAMRGNTDEARVLYAEVLAHGSRDFLWLRSRRGLGLLELGAGRAEAAVNSLEQLDVMARTLGRPDLSFGIYEHDLALGYVQTGRRADAEELTERFAVLVEASNHATAEPVLAYMRGLLSPDDEIEERFSRAVELARPTPFLHVRALTAWAERAAQRGQVAVASSLLSAAREIAEAIGAPGLAQWVDRAALTVPHIEAVPDSAGARAQDESRPEPVVDPAVPDGELDHTTMLCVLGRWELQVDGAAAPAPAPDGVPGRALRLLALRRQVHVEELTELLWPESDAASGRMRLRNVVSRIRASVGPVVERRGELVALSPHVTVDADHFAALARAAHVAAESGDLQHATVLAESAVALYVGPLLPDSPYADWALVARERCRRLYVGLLDLLTSTAVERGDIDAALGFLERAVEEEPYEEERYLRAAEMCVAAGRRGAAASLLERAVTVADKLGVPPDPRQAALAARLRQGKAAAAGG